MAPEASLQAPAAQPQAELGSDPLIAAVQEELKRLALFEGDVDGVYSPTLRSAISTAIAEYRLDVQAFPSRKLLARLKSQPIVEPETARVAAPSVAAPPEIKPAQPRKIVNPEYPHGALNRQIEGWVEVACDVDPQGKVHNVRLSDAESEQAVKVFSAAALKAVQATIFHPATADGKPVWSHDVKRRFRFAINN
jgi:TonB family protein